MRSVIDGDVNIEIEFHVNPNPRNALPLRTNEKYYAKLQSRHTGCSAFLEVFTFLRNDIYSITNTDFLHERLAGVCIRTRTDEPAIGKMWDESKKIPETAVLELE